MRVDPFYVVNLSSSLDQTQSRQEQLTQELSSGLRVNSIGDDPVAAAENVQLLNTIQRDDSFTQTTSLTQGRLQVTDSALGSVVTQLNQALSLAGPPPYPRARLCRVQWPGGSAADTVSAACRDVRRSGQGEEIRSDPSRRQEPSRLAATQLFPC